MDNEFNPIGLSAILGQLKTMISGLKPGMYNQALEVLNGATIGKHIRHIHDFYKAVVQGAADGIIDYNRRDRDEAIENSPELAIQQFELWLSMLETLDTDNEVLVCASIGYGATPAMIKSSLEREMMYAYDHAIHHLALIKIGFDSAHDQRLPADFGVAPSTLHHHKNLTNG
ncbi:MAG: DinB family protein [Saprospiraceae bacterium]|nr:DinB family protein [Saprospiraceae bacterium]